MNEDRKTVINRTYLRRGYLWHRYYLTVNRVMMATGTLWNMFIPMVLLIVFCHTSQTINSSPLCDNFIKSMWCDINHIFLSRLRYSKISKIKNFPSLWTSKNHILDNSLSWSCILKMNLLSFKNICEKIGVLYTFFLRYDVNIGFFNVFFIFYNCHCATILVIVKKCQNRYLQNITK